jgi:MFS family permease
MGLMQFATLFTLFLWEDLSANMVTALVFLATLTGAFLDVIVDALMVTQSRQDEDDGSEQLQTLSWCSMGVGGVFGSLVAGYMTEYYHPKWSFLIYSFYGIVVATLGMLLDIEKTDPSL